MTPTSLVAYLVLFAAAAFAFVFAALLLGRFIRPCVPTPEKLQTYECGEPSVGSSFIQFDVRFYVVALVFLVFEVEVAFFFPWATVLGKLNRLADPNLTSAAEIDTYRSLGVANQEAASPSATGQSTGRESDDIRALTLAAMVDMAVFFAALLLGFAYVWYRGDLNWVRATGSGPPAPPQRPDILVSTR